MIAWFATSALAAPLEAEFRWEPHPLGSMGRISATAHVLGAIVDLDAPCECDVAHLRCRPIEFDRGPGLVVYWGVGSIEDWPVVAGPTGSCEHAGQEIVVSATFELSSLPMWVRGQEVVVPLTNFRVWRMETLDVSVPEQARLFGSEEDPVQCLRSDAGKLQVFVRAPEGAPEVSPCASWGSEEISVRLLPYVLAPSSSGKGRRR